MSRYSNCEPLFFAVIDTSSIFSFPNPNTVPFLTTQGLGCELDLVDWSSEIACWRASFHGLQNFARHHSPSTFCSALLGDSAMVTKGSCLRLKFKSRSSWWIS